MKKAFEEPIVEVAAFSVEDIITTSDGGYTPDPDEAGGAPLYGN